MAERTRKQDSELVRFAKDELSYYEKSPDQGIQKTKKKVIELMKAFDDPKMSSMERIAVVSLFAKLAYHIPLSPLTGKDEEWEEVTTDKNEDNPIKWQNKRCPRVYKRANGTAFDSAAIIYSYGDGIWFRNEQSNIDITFPYKVEPSKRMIVKE